MKKKNGSIKAEIRGIKKGFSLLFGFFAPVEFCFTKLIRRYSPAFAFFPAVGISTLLAFVGSLSRLSYAGIRQLHNRLAHRKPISFTPAFAFFPAVGISTLLAFVGSLSRLSYAGIRQLHNRLAHRKPISFTPAFAFSLIELMLSIVVLSCIIAAFSPVISKKISASEISILRGGCKVTANCNELVPTADGHCTFCAYCDDDIGNYCIACNRKNPPTGQGVNVELCKFENCSENCVSCQWDIIEKKLQCTKCKDTYYLDKNICKPCPDGYYCDGVTKKECEKGYYCTGGVKKQCTGLKYQNETGKSSCKDCSTNCSVCDSISGACTSCPAGRILKNNNCETCKGNTYSKGGNATACTACSTTCATCNNTNGDCTSCTGLRYLSGTTCAECNPSCYKCNNTNGNCTSCKAGYYYKDNKTCVACSAGTFQKSNESYATSCKSCDVGCYECSKTTGACTSCKAGYYKSGSSCLACSVGTYQKDNGYSQGTCTGCTAGTYNTTEGSSGCLSCSSGCYSCDKTTGNCITCKAGYYKNGNKCSACAAGTHQDSNNSNSTYCDACNVSHCAEYSSGCTCSSCNAGYSLSDNTCSACNVAHCKEYSSGCTCNACETNWTPDGAGGCKQNIAKTKCNGLTWTTTNPGVSGGPPIPSGTTCYDGKCNRWAGQTICSNIGMRIPTEQDANSGVGCQDALNIGTNHIWTSRETHRGCCGAANENGCFWWVDNCTFFYVKELTWGNWRETEGNYFIRCVE